jgi:hypothetical protein
MVNFARPGDLLHRTRLETTCQDHKYRKMVPILSEKGRVRSSPHVGLFIVQFLDAFTCFVGMWILRSEDIERPALNRRMRFVANLLLFTKRVGDRSVVLLVEALCSFGRLENEAAREGVNSDSEKLLINR